MGRKPPLAVQAIRYFSAGLESRLLVRRPLFLTLFVTERCGLNCGHCFISEEAEDRRASPELSLDEYAMLARRAPPFPKLVLTGGEPFLRPDLARIAMLFHDSRTRTRQITIPTAGAHTRPVVELVEALLPGRPDLVLELQLSIDGIGENHDAIRGPGQFQKLMETHQALAALASRHPGLRIRFNFTFSPVTQGWFPETFHHVTRTLGCQRMDMVLIRHQTRDPRFWEQVDPDLYDQAADLLYELDRQSAGLNPLRRLLAMRTRQEREIIVDHHLGTQRMHDCQAGTLFAIVDQTGNVNPCELMDHTYGNLRDHDFDFEGIWRGQRARAHRRALRSSGCYCTFETSVRTTLSFQPRWYGSMLMTALDRPWRTGGRYKRSCRPAPCDDAR